MRAIRKRLLAIGAAVLVTGALALSHTNVADAQAKPGATKPVTQADKDKARKLYGDAQKKMKAGDYAGALTLFQKADEAYPGAAPKHNIALCLDKLGRTEEAVAAYRAFIDSEPDPEKYGERVASSRERIAELEATMEATINLEIGPPGLADVQILVDKQPAGTELKLKPGTHQIAVSATGHEPFEQALEVKPNEKRQLQITLKPTAATPPPPTATGEATTTTPAPTATATGEEEVPEEGGRSNIPAYVTLGIAGAGAILGIVFGIQALGSKSDFDDAVGDGNTPPTATNDELTEMADDAERSALIADMSFGVALTFGITGAVLLFSGGEEEPAEASAKPVLLPYAGPTGGGMAATWTF